MKVTNFWGVMPSNMVKFTHVSEELIGFRLENQTAAYLLGLIQ
jgi:hypothetical protein